MLGFLSYISQYIFLFILHIAHSESFPKPLKKSEEQHYLELAAKGDIGARNILVEHNLRLVAHIIKKYYQNYGGQDDLVSIGTIGLIKAINTFNIDKNIKLSSYASRCIENEILMFFRNNRKSAQDVSLNDTIDKFFPEYAHGSEITVYQLLHMQSGIRRELMDTDLKTPETVGKEEIEKFRSIMLE